MDRSSKPTVEYILMPTGSNGDPQIADYIVNKYDKNKGKVSPQEAERFVESYEGGISPLSLERGVVPHYRIVFPRGSLSFVAIDLFRYVHGHNTSERNTISPFRNAENKIDPEQLSNVLSEYFDVDKDKINCVVSQAFLLHMYPHGKTITTMYERSDIFIFCADHLDDATKATDIWQQYLAKCIWRIAKQKISEASFRRRVIVEVNSLLEELEGDIRKDFCKELLEDLRSCGTRQYLRGQITLLEELDIDGKDKQLAYMKLIESPTDFTAIQNVIDQYEEVSADEIAKDIMAAIELLDGSDKDLAAITRNPWLPDEIRDYIIESFLGLRYEGLNGRNSIGLDHSSEVRAERDKLEKSKKELVEFLNQFSWSPPDNPPPGIGTIVNVLRENFAGIAVMVQNSVVTPEQGEELTCRLLKNQGLSIDVEQFRLLTYQALPALQAVSAVNAQLHKGLGRDG